MAEMNKIDESQRLTLNEQGGWVYPSGSATGHVEIELPALPGSPNAVERMHVANFGPFVATKIENSMNRQGYLRSGPQQSAPQVLKHYCATARGAGLMDAGALKRMDDIAREFEAEGDREAYYEMVVRPYLHTLSPKRR